MAIAPENRDSLMIIHEIGNSSGILLEFSIGIPLDIFPGIALTFLHRFLQGFRPDIHSAILLRILPEIPLGMSLKIAFEIPSLAFPEISSGIPSRIIPESA